MIKDLLRWVAPGVLTVAGGTAVALAMTTPAMVETLEQQGRDAMHRAGAEWAHVSVTGRNVLLTGTTSSDAEKNAAVAELSLISGLAAVDETVTVAPLASPYRLNVAVEGGRVSLFGSVPNEELRQQLLRDHDVADADLQIRSGQPDEALWRNGVEFAFSQAAHVDDGYFELSGLTLNAVGRARSEKALGELDIALAALPAGISAGTIALEPMRVTPYTWRAEFDGNRIAISGHVPEEQVADRLRTADVSGIPVATGLSLASGAPDGFAEQTKLLVEQLARLEQGEARITDGVSLLVGVPPTVEVAQAVNDAMSGTNSIVQLSAPRVADYWVSINRQSGGALVFDGYVPDEPTRDAFADIAGADVSFLKYGGGAPGYYRSTVDLGLELLGHLSEGRFSLSGGTVSISGVALSPTDYRSATSLLSTGLPQGVTLASQEIQAPRAANYTFAVRRDAGGSVTLEGLLPDPALESALLTAAGARATSTVTFASGEPQNFAAAAEQAIAFIPWLRSGKIAFDGDVWTIEGEPNSAIDQGSIETEFAVRGLASSRWTLALTEAPQAPGFADPYLWSAERLPDGSFLFAGNVPAASLQAWLKVHVGTRVADTSRVANGAPPEFAQHVRAAVAALMALEEGRVVFDGDTWAVSGTAADAAARTAATELVASFATLDGAAISIPAAAPSLPYAWSATKTSAGVALEGAVPAESLQRFLAVRAGAEVEDRTEVRADAPDGFASDVLQAMDVLALLRDGRVAFDGNQWVASGNALAPGAIAAATEVLGTNAPAWRLTLSDPEAVESQTAVSPAEPTDAASQPPGVATVTEPTVSREEPVPAPVTPQTSAADLAQCRARLAELSAHNAILFQSGAAIIAASATAELDAFAQALLLCPDSMVDVEGHTDSDGDDQQNLALSVARAEAVVTALIERGVSGDRLYAIGYGESRPVADNATADGKRQNRRIVVSIRGADEEG
ncbi:Outer membrane protein OmpA [Devosia lucknowensis]|uniref:Outer membrane protein OmpA n=1 Tax=Devosia lucknowensis TaxID=1096929 RepID=A0A1Y6EJT4_9HYPH|nr:OmpA family protein [Devosia lucknowensis]SMQ62609.1 Outer membrane protein OmpA [Devosia lucknowensis]